jgi:predicted short-subunit dehydrogenase-like oxidoreductase (DUF2520 family)
MIEKVVIIGAGNVATHLSKAIKNAGVEILQIVSRTEESARELGTLLNVPFTCIPTEINTEADLYIVSVKDDTIVSALTTFSLPENALVVHTAGSVPMEILKDFSANIGILYPLQTFSKAKDVNFKEIPVYIEANTQENTSKLLQFASAFSDRAKEVNSSMRAQVHLAAVFACNFTNNLYAIASDILEKAGLGFEDMLPLIGETTEKIKTLHPRKAQTGPAIRRDSKVIEKQLNALEGREKQIYKLITESIQDEKF